jgi:hypothetical protein
VELRQAEVIINDFQPTPWARDSVYGHPRQNRGHGLDGNESTYGYEDEPSGSCVGIPGFCGTIFLQLEEKLSDLNKLGSAVCLARSVNPSIASTFLVLEFVYLERGRKVVWILGS